MEEVLSKYGNILDRVPFAKDLDCSFHIVVSSREVAKEKEAKIDELSYELQNFKLNGKEKLSHVPENLRLTKEQIRNRLMTFGLSVQQKMDNS